MFYLKKGNTEIADKYAEELETGLFNESVFTYDNMEVHEGSLDDCGWI